jgi:hypothetical protein
MGHRFLVLGWKLRIEVRGIPRPSAAADEAPGASGLKSPAEISERWQWVNRTQYHFDQFT